MWLLLLLPQMMLTRVRAAQERAPCVKLSLSCISGMGLHAGGRIEAGMFVCEYVGELIRCCPCMAYPVSPSLASALLSCDVACTVRIVAQTGQAPCC